MKKPRKLHLHPSVPTFAVAAVLLAAVNLLPPDTSLQLVQETGFLRACVPESYPPLVTGNAANPGFDVSLLEQIAARMNLRLALNVVPSMGRDFNPRNWRITRANCEVVAGGVTTSPLTRSFLETISTGIENSWVLLSQAGKQLGPGVKVGVYPGFYGLDRTRLSSYVRGLGASIVLARSTDDLVHGLGEGSYDVAIAGSLDARRVTDAVPALSVSTLPESLGRYSFGVGLWKGDLTLKREVSARYDQLDREGVLEQLRKRYQLLPAEMVRVPAQ